MRHTLIALLVLALPAWAAFAPEEGRASSDIVALEFRVVSPEGRVLHLHFSVRAEDEAEAWAAAAAGLRSILPGARPLLGEEGVATAQHAPWGWAWATSEIPVKVAYNPEGAVPGAGPDAIAGPMQTWSKVAGSSFAFENVGFTGEPPSLHTIGRPDGENTIAWIRMDCSLGCVLGVTARDEIAHEADIALNSNPQAGLGDGSAGTVDTHSVVLHELGHVAGLEHSCPDILRCTTSEEEAVMYYRYRGTKRTLRPDDIAGISARYPSGPAPAPTPPVLPEEPEPAVVIDVALSPGWNLVTLPAGPVGSFIDRLPCAAAVYGWAQGGWGVWVRGVSPSLRPTSTGQAGMAYWVLAGAACAATFR